MTTFVLIGGVLMLVALNSCREQSRETIVQNPQDDGPFSMSQATLRSDFTLAQQSVRTSAGTDRHKSVLVYLANPDSAQSVSGGEISINGVEIPGWTEYGQTWYQNRDPGHVVPLNIDGSMHLFRVAGAAGYPAFTDSLPAPAAETVILDPAPNAVISRSAGFTLSWGIAGHVDGVHIVIDDTARSVGSKSFSKTLIGADPGTLAITAGDLSTLKPGPLSISVFRGNIKDGEADERRKYRLMIYSSQQINATLAP